MTEISGDNYRLAGFQLSTDDQGNMAQIFAVFSKRDQNPETLHTDFVPHMMAFLAGEPEDIGVVSMFAYDILTAATDPESIASNEDKKHMVPVIEDLGAENLSKSLRAMTGLRLGKLERNSRYYVAATDKKPRKTNLKACG
jgi:hypothetical protein